MAREAIATAYVQLTTSAEGITDSISESLGGAGSKEGSNFGESFIKGAGAVIAASAAAVAGTIGALWQSATATAAAGDEIAKGAGKLKISTDEYQVLAFAAEHCQFEMSNLLTAQNKLMDSGFEGSIYEAIEAIMSLDDETERTALASELFGDRATIAMANLLDGTETLEEFKAELSDLGGLMSDESVSDAAKFQDSMTNIETAMNGLRNSLLSKFLPGLSTVMDGLAAVISGDDSGVEAINEGIGSVISNIETLLPEFLTIGADIILAIGNSVIENLPRLVETAFSIVSKLALALVDALPMIAEIAVDVILTLVKGLTDTIPKLIPAAVNAVITLTQSLTAPECILSILRAAVELILALATGIIDAIPVLLNAVPEIIANIIVAIIEFLPEISLAGYELFLALVEELPEIIIQLLTACGMIVDEMIKLFRTKQFQDQMKDAGMRLLEGFIKGIKEFIPNVLETVKGAAGNIIDTMKDAFGIHSPSRVFAEIGKYLDEGLANGIGDNVSAVENAMDSLAGDMTASVNADVTGAISSAPYRASGVASSNDAGLYSLLAQYLPILADKEASVQLVGDANGMFNIIRNQNEKWRKSTGVSAFV